MRTYLAAVAVLLCSGVVAAQTLSYGQAKARADESGGRLSPNELQRLVEAQGEFAGGAFARCISRTGSAPTSFTVVVEVGSDGRVRDSWLRGESSFAHCFRERMVVEFSFRPSSLPFFTAFAYTHAP